MQGYHSTFAKTRQQVCAVTETVAQRPESDGLRYTRSGRVPATVSSGAASIAVTSIGNLRPVLSWEHGWGYTT